MRIGRLRVSHLRPYFYRHTAGATITWREWHWEPRIVWGGKMTHEERGGQSFKAQSQPVHQSQPPTGEQGSS
jgi:hypothetical protein